MKWVSKVWPRILGVLSKGTWEPLIRMVGESLDCLLSGVKSVTDDLWGAIES